MFSDFDFSVLDSPTFKEDAVREEIIAPIVRRLGYAPSGSIRVQRSKTLIHPYVMIGSKRHPVNIVPDYTLYADDKALAVLEAKGPQERIIQSDHVEQAYSYAIHPEVRADHYALCNGRDLVVYNTRQFAPILQVAVPEIEARWAEVEEALHPKFLTNPELRGFAPDYGLTMLKAGVRPDAIHGVIRHPLNLLALVRDDLYTAATTTLIGGIEYVMTLDFSANMCRRILARLPPEIAEQIAATLSRAPFQVRLDGTVLLSCSGHLGEVATGEYEDFVPILVSDITEVLHDPTVVSTPPK